jgi:RimJ/RimL family protein N-acetyltransferase
MALQNSKSPSLFDPIAIDTEFFKIRSMLSTTWEKVADGILYENSFHATNWGIKTRDDVQKLYQNSLKAWENKKGHPLVFLSSDEAEVYGISNFMNVEPENKMIEIGGTWIAKKWQRSPVNTGTKFELLRYIFEVLKFNRVEFRIDADNTVSQKAIERLGVQFEGHHKRRKVNANQDIRDYKFYAVTDLDWPEVKAQMTELTMRKKDPFEIEISKIKNMLRRGENEKAFEATLDAIQKNPRHAGLQYLAASICDGSRTEAEAVPFYLKALELGLPKFEKRDAILGLGSTYRSLGEYEKSKKIFEQGIEEYPKYRAYRVFLAMTEYNLKNSEKAVSLLLKELVATTCDTGTKSYHRALDFYADRLNQVFE